jgi:Ca2+-binding RTX toxin-like protein
MGNDLLIGGLGHDTFKFSKVSEIGIQKHDVIADFVSGDLIDLSAIDATKGLGKNDAFQWIDNSADVTRDNANGALWFKNGVLYGSTDKDVEAEFQIELTGVTSLNVHEIVL